MSKHKAFPFKVASFDGVVLQGVYLKLTPHYEGMLDHTLVYVHSYSTSKAEGVKLIDQCQANNINLCIVDSRACGASKGKYIHFGFKEHIDLLFVLFYIIENHESRNFILWGRGLGCNTVLQLASVLVHNTKISSTAKGVVRHNASNLEYSEIDQKYLFTSLIVKEQDVVFDYFEDFVMKNGFAERGRHSGLEFSIKEIVLEAPHCTVRKMIEQSLSRIVGVAPRILQHQMGLYVRNYYNRKLKVKLDTYQNAEIVKQLSINATFVVDPLDRFAGEVTQKSLAESYGSNTKNRIQAKRFTISNR